MTFDHNQIDSLMDWARLQAPQFEGWNLDGTKIPRRRVRVEIGPGTNDRAAFQNWPTDERIVCRVYLAEPRCWKPDTGQAGLKRSGMVHDMPQLDKQCECGQLAETRIG